MQKILNSGVEFVDLIPGASIRVTYLGGGGYSIITLANKEGNATFNGASTEKTGAATAGPFSNVATLRIETKGRAALSVLQPDVQGSWRVVGAPGTVTAAELNAVMASLSASGGGSLLFPSSTAAYVFDDELLVPSNVSVILCPGVKITRPDPFTLTGTTTNTSTGITLTSGTTELLKVGYYHCQYVVGTGIPVAARVNTVSSRTVFDLDLPATASGSVSLTFHYAHNVFRRSGATNVRIMAPWGRATIDGNGGASPLTGDSADALRNCIRTENCIDIETSGVTLTNAHYHGEIGDSNAGVIRYNNVRTLRNGFRGIHLHGKSGVYGVADVQIDDIEICQDGYKAWTIQNDQLSSGLFVVFDSMSRIQVGKVRVKDVPGYGVHLSGTVSAGTRSGLVSYESIVCEDVGVPVGILNGLRNARIGVIQARGRLTTLTNCVLGTGTQALPLWGTATSYVAGAVMQSFICPPGTDMSQFSIGHAVYMQEVAAGVNEAAQVVGAGLDKQLAIWAIDAPSRKITVFTYGSPAVRPWPTASDTASNVTVTIWSSRGPGLYLAGAATNNLDLQDISIGSTQFETIGGAAISVLNAGTAARYVNGMDIGHISMRDCYKGSYFYNFNDLYIGSVSAVGSGNRRVGNDTGSVDLLLLNGNGATIGRANLVTKTNGSMTRNNAACLQLNTANVSDVKILDLVAENGNSSNFAVDWTNSVRVMLGDPRNASGTSIVPTGAATNGSAFKYGLT